ncbi:hypothetical protein [Floridanema aerugineum]|uniref:Uncharacterized protein n=1 Tax=Floridaenema aerugineum BLCC-F46 TaxID=3153654 RepID=A0ABV4X4F7_9CYAN
MVGWFAIAFSTLPILFKQISKYVVGLERENVEQKRNNVPFYSGLKIFPNLINQLSFLANLDLVKFFPGW